MVDCRSEGAATGVRNTKKHRKKRDRTSKKRLKCIHCKLLEARTGLRGWARGMCQTHAIDNDCEDPHKKKLGVKVKKKSVASAVKAQVKVKKDVGGRGTGSAIYSQRGCYMFTGPMREGPFSSSFRSLYHFPHPHISAGNICSKLFSLFVFICFFGTFFIMLLPIQTGA